MITLAVTGHRPTKLGGYGTGAMLRVDRFAYQTLKQESRIVSKVITGMALGWDQAIAKACICLRIPFIAAIPFRGQEALWPAAAQALYHNLLEAAEVKYISEGGYGARKMQQRNIWMVDQCDAVAALWNGEPEGGTAGCVEYADKTRKPVIHLWESWMIFK